MVYIIFINDLLKNFATKAQNYGTDYHQIWN